MSKVDLPEETRLAYESVDLPIEWNVTWSENTNPRGCGQWITRSATHETEARAREHFGALVTIERVFNEHIRYPLLQRRRGGIPATGWQDMEASPLSMRAT